jgi:hypothetical protein
MKAIKSLIALACAVAFLGSLAIAADAPCCAKAKAAGKECTHECCVKAAKDGKVCEKCGGKTEEKKKDK